MNENNNYTLKEIFEGPESIEKSINQNHKLEELASSISKINVNNIIITGSGTSYNAGLASIYFLHKYLKIPTFVVHAAEFEYLVEPILNKNQLIILISQSGESATTLNACKLANERQIKTLSITAHPESTLGKLTSYCLPILSGDEQSIMATKTYIAQISALFAFSIQLSKQRETINQTDYNRLFSELQATPGKLQKALPDLKIEVQKLAKYYKFVNTCFLLGTGGDYATALEGALKFKEGSRILAQAYSADEFRHGPITLADQSALIIMIIPQDIQKRKIIYKLCEKLKERHTTILGISTSKDDSRYFDNVLGLPEINDDFSPIITVVPLQLLANFIAIERGYDPDKPRFLTKIVNE